MHIQIVIGPQKQLVEKRGMNLKESVGGKMGGFERREKVEEMLPLIISKET